MIESCVMSCWSAIKRTISCGLWQWKELEFTILESNRQSAERTAKDKSQSEWRKTKQLAGKVITSVLWEAEDMIFIDYLKKGKTVKSEYFMSLLARINEEMPKNGTKWRQTKKKIHRVNGINDKTVWIAFRVAFSSIVFSNFGSQRLLPVNPNKC